MFDITNPYLRRIVYNMWRNTKETFFEFLQRKRHHHVCRWTKKFPYSFDVALAKNHRNAIHRSTVRYYIQRCDFMIVVTIRINRRNRHGVHAKGTLGLSWSWMKRLHSLWKTRYRWKPRDCAFIKHVVLAHHGKTRGHSSITSNQKRVLLDATLQWCRILIKTRQAHSQSVFSLITARFINHCMVRIKVW